MTPAMHDFYQAVIKPLGVIVLLSALVAALAGGGIWLLAKLLL